MKFAHLADSHLGAFGKNPALRDLNLKAFEEAIEKCLEENVDFILIAGDLFHNPIPDLEIVKRAVEILRNARNRGIRIYVIYGSHDFSAGTTSLLDVLSSTGLFKKAVNYDFKDGKIFLKGVRDESGVNIVGISGLSSSKEVEYFKKIDAKSLENIPEPKIFAFHTTIDELKPSYISDKNAVPLSSLPKNFNYYAGGHLHERIEYKFNSSPLIYPGALFGSSYNDLDILKDRGFYIVENFKPKFIPIKVCDFFKKKIDASGLDAKSLERKILEMAKDDYGGKVVILKIHGKLKSGRIGDIDFHRIREEFKKTAIDFLLNTYNLSTMERERISIAGSSREDIENKIFKGISIYGFDFTKKFFNVVKEPKPEDMRKGDFEEMLWKNTYPLIEEIIKEKGKSEEVSEVKREKKKMTIFDFEG